MRISTKEITLRNGKTLILRSAAVADAENMLKHLYVAHSESYKNLNQSATYWQKFAVKDEEKILMDFEQAANKFMLVALDEKQIVGGLGCVGYHAEFNKRNASLGMSIQKKYQGIGLGTAMMLYMLEQAQIAGFHRLDLTVRTYNTAGIALYEKAGFERVGLLKDMAFIDGEYVSEYSYQKILGSR